MTLTDAVTLVRAYQLTPAQLEVFEAVLAVFQQSVQPKDLDLFRVFMHLFTDAMCSEWCTPEDPDMSQELYCSDLLTRVQDLFVAKCLLFEYNASRHDEEPQS